MSELNNNAQKATKQRQRIPSLNADARIELRVKRLRTLVVGGRLRSKFFQGPRGRETTSGKIWYDFTCMESYIWEKSPARIAGCVEHEVLSAMSRRGPLSPSAFEDVRHKALLQARAAAFDYVVSEALITKGWGDLLTMRRAHFAAQLLRDPFSITVDASLASTMAEGIDQSGVNFLRRLSDVLHNLNRRRTQVCDDCLFVLATNWINPHCPLWLMTREAIHKACVGLTTGLNVTSDMINDRLKNFDFLRAHTRPIVGVELNDNGKIKGFVVSRNIHALVQTKQFHHPDGREYCLTISPARHRSYTRVGR